MSEKEPTFNEAFERDYQDTDFYLYLGPIRRPYDDYVIDDLRKRKKKKNIMVFMTTSGGDPNAAYRIARAIQRQYGIEKKDGTVGDAGQPERRFVLFVNNYCVSAGTLVALGATDLVLSDYAELGPLDVQIRRPDEPMERDSGLTSAQALTSLERRSKSLFREHFEQLRNDSAISLTTRTAVENAGTITSGLMGSIYAQIDPMRLGEVERLMQIAAEYGRRLGQFNIKEDTIPRLLNGYPSHSFVIDRREARDLFENVERPRESIVKLCEFMRPIIDSREYSPTPLHFYFSVEADISYEESKENENEVQDSGQRRKDSAGKSKGNAKTGDTSEKRE